jgi:hypothetical protein
MIFDRFDGPVKRGIAYYVVVNAVVAKPNPLPSLVKNIVHTIVHISN